MRAFEYGIEHFGAPKYKEIKSRIHVFDDGVEILETVEQKKIREAYKPGLYRQIVQDRSVTIGNNSVPGFSELLPANGGKEFSREEIDYLQESGSGLNLTESYSTAKPVWHEEEKAFHEEIIYKMGDEYYINIPDSNKQFGLKNVPISGAKRWMLPVMQMTPVTINNNLIGENISTIFFISSDGAKLNNAFIEIDDLQPNEVIFFAESDDSYNILGSVVLVKTGSNVQSTAGINYDSLYFLKDHFKLNFDPRKLYDVLAGHLKDKSRMSFVITEKVKEFYNKVVSVPQEYIMGGLITALETISAGIDTLRLGDEYWKYYDEDGKKLKETSLLIPVEPVIDWVQQASAALKNNNRFGELKRSVDEWKQTIQQYEFVYRLFGKVFDFIDGLLLGVDKLLNGLLDEMAQKVTDALVEFNAFIVGLINSIIDLVKCVFDLIALILKVIKGIQHEAQQAILNPMVYIDMFVEMFENTIEMVIKMFTLENLKAFFSFWKKLFTMIGKSLLAAANMKADKVGYYKGYIVGLIVQEVVMLLCTGGAANVADALEKVAQSVRATIKAAGKLARTVGKGIVGAPENIIKVIGKFLNEIKKQASRLPEFLEEVLVWIGRLLEGGKAVVTDVTEWLLKQYKMTQATIDLFKELGITIIDNAVDILAGSRQMALSDARYTLKYQGTGLLDGTNDVIRAFSKKIEDISGKKGKQAVRRWLETAAAENSRLGKVSDWVIEVLITMADEAKIWSSRRRPQTCGVLDGKGRRIFNYSFKQKLAPGIFPDDLHPLVREWVEKMWKLHKEGKFDLPIHHGKCSEVRNISEWLNIIDPQGKMTLREARFAFKGVVSHSRQIDKIVKDGVVIIEHGSFKPACNSCNPLLKYFNIKEYKIK